MQWAHNTTVLNRPCWANEQQHVRKVGYRQTQVRLRADLPLLTKIDAILANDRESWFVCDVKSSRTNNCINFALLAVFTEAHPDVQVYVAVYTLMLTFIDNFSIDPTMLPTCIGDKGWNDNPISQWLSEHLLKAHDYFLPHAANSIIISTMKWLNSMRLDAIVDGYPLSKGAMSFAEYRRMQSGAPDAYAFFIFDKFNHPNIYTFIQMIP